MTNDRFTIVMVPSPMLQVVIHITDNRTGREYLSVIGTNGGTSIIELPSYIKL